MGLIYAKDGKLYANGPVDICIPGDYFDEKNTFAIRQGNTIETFGLLFIRAVENGNPGKIQLLNIPTIISINVYDSVEDTITVNGQRIPVIVSQYLGDAEIMTQYIVQGREEAEAFLKLVIAGKLPRVISYEKLIDIWWKNLEISGVSFKVPSKIYELILATVYRNPNNFKQRFGELYGTEKTPNGYNYVTGSVRNIVANLSTFAGFVFEDMNQMISNGVLNELEGNEEPVSPLEKIISY